MPKTSLSFVCQNCGAAFNRWQGKCESCGEWNTLVEEAAEGTSIPASIRSKRRGRLFTLESLTGKSADAPRHAVGHGRTRSRHRRRLRARLGVAAGRRSRHRQIDFRLTKHLLRRTTTCAR